MIMESQFSGLVKMGLGKLVSFPNFDYESHAMSVTCTIILMILYTTHNILHIAHILLHIEHNIFHIIHLYAMRPWNHGLDNKTSKNEGSTYGTSTRKPSLENTEVVSFIHTYFFSFR